MFRKKQSPMYHIVETEKSFDQVTTDLDASVKTHGFGVLHIHDLGETLKNKGVPFAERCRVFEVCNPKQAARVMQNDMRLNMALPCRISVYTEEGKTYIGLIKPEYMLSALSDSDELREIALEVENKIIEMVDQSK